MNERLEFLRTVRPFDTLPNEVLEEVAGLLEEVEHPRERILYEQDQTKLRGLDIVVAGEYEAFFYDSQMNKRHVEHCGPGCSYGGISVLLNKKRSLRTVLVKKGTRVYFLHRRDFRALCKAYEDFFNYFTTLYGQRMLDEEYAHFINPSHQSPAQNYIASDQLYSRRLEAMEVRALVACPGSTPIYEVARRMAEARTSCYFITESEDAHSPVTGYVTDITLRDKVVAGLTDARQPVATIAAAPVVEINSSAYVYEAILLMFRTKTRYLLVKKGEEYVGFVSRNKLLSDQAQSPFIFIQSVKQALSVPALRRRWQQVPEMVYQLLDRGVKAEIVNQVITSVSDTIALKVIEGVMEEMGPPPAKFVFMVLGSEGRKEQTLLTDQDNAIIYEDTAGEQREAVRAYFLKFAESVSDRLNTIGFSFCEGGFMAKNSKWTHSLSHWKRNYQEWMSESNPETVMKFAAFFDCRYLYGEASVMEELQQFLHEELQAPRERFFYYMAINALQFEPPLTTFFNNIRTFAVGSQQVFNLKKAMTPIVDLARIYALRHRVFATNTGERLEALHQLDVFTEKEYRELLQSYYYLMGVRLKKQAVQIITDRTAPDNYLDPKSVTKVEQVTLKEIFKVISDFQVKIKVGFAKVL